MMGIPSHVAKQILKEENKGKKSSSAEIQKQNLPRDAIDLMKTKIWMTKRLPCLRL